MRFILRPLFLYLVSLGLIDILFPFITIRSQYVLLSAAVVYFILNVIFKPFLKILWLPINLITLGLFSWMVNVVVVFAVTMIVPGFTLTPASFPGLQVGHFLIPPINLSIVWTYLLFSFLISVTVGFFDWLLVRED
jgi:putative membrane protein